MTGYRRRGWVGVLYDKTEHLEWETLIVTQTHSCLSWIQLYNFFNLADKKKHPGVLVVDKERCQTKTQFKRTEQQTRQNQLGLSDEICLLYFAFEQHKVVPRRCGAVIDSPLTRKKICHITSLVIELPSLYLRIKRKNFRGPTKQKART